MKCEKCGQMMGNSAAFCPNCGEKADSKAQAEAKAKQKKLALYAGIGISVVLVIALIISLIGGSGYKSGYEGAIEHFIDFYIYYQRDKENMLAMAPAVVWQTWADVKNNGDINELFREFSEIGEQARKENKDLIKKTKATYQVNYPTKLSVQECQQVERALENRDDVNYSAITEAYSFALEVDVVALVDGEKKEEKCDWDIIAVKMDGKWHLAEGSVSGSNIRWLMDRFFNRAYSDISSD